MSFLDKIFKKDNTSYTKSSDAVIDIKADGNSINVGDVASITFISDCAGSYTESNKNDFYVYEWFIVDTGEIFYVGKGRGDRFKEYHTSANEAEKIRGLFNTDSRFVGENLTEDAALELETKEMTRILNETSDILTNRITPIFAKRGNGHSKAPSTPKLQFETYTVFYASELEEHYYGITWQPFDTVVIDNLKSPVILDKQISNDEIEIIYGGDYKKYYDEVVMLLNKHGSKILKSKYAKSVSSWIYPFEDYVLNHEMAEKNAIEQIGHDVPSYHLIDVWKALVSLYGKPDIVETKSIEIKPIHNRVPLNEIKNKNNWDKGFDAGFEFWEKGEFERKSGNLEAAIELYDKARYNGYFAPALYNSYAMAYRKKKDYENEIAILEEAIERFKDNGDNSQSIIGYEERRKKAIEKLIKKKE